MQQLQNLYTMQWEQKVPHVPDVPHDRATDRNLTAGQSVVSHWESGRQAIVLAVWRDRIEVQYFDQQWVGAKTNRTLNNGV